MPTKKKEHSADKLEDSLNIFQDESDRACAILGAAHLDYLLEKVIENHLIDDDKIINDIFKGPNAPLSTLSSRINMAYALSIINADVKKELDTIRSIRNAFAHNLEVHTFERDQSTKDLCNNFYRAIRYTQSLKEPHRSGIMAPRNLYIYTVIIVSDELKVKSGILPSKPKRNLMYKSISSTIQGDHFYTISPEEKDDAMKKYGYREEKIECYVNDIKQKGTIPLYRLYSFVTRIHARPYIQ